MSAETLKFFEEKSTEQIINWMIENLRDDQIRACLDQSGIPDTEEIKKEPSQPAAAAASSSAPFAAAAASPAPAPVMPAKPSTLFDIAPVIPSIASSSTDLVYTQNYPDDGRLDELRKKCQSSGLLINAIKDGMVEFYQVVETDEDEEYTVISNVSDGEYGWVKKILSLKEFEDNQCDDIDIETYETAKSNAQSKFESDIPEEVMEVARIYAAKNITAPFLPPIDITPPEAVVVTEVMKFALSIQKKSPKIMETEYKELYDLGLTLFPVFIYGEENDYTIQYLSTVVGQDGKLMFVEKTANKRIAKGLFKQDVTAISNAYKSGNYVPEGNIVDELKALQNNVDPEIKNKLNQIYDPLRADYFTYFGDNHMYDSDNEPMLMPLIAQDSILNSPPTSPITSRSMSPITSFSKKKKPSEMSIPELEEHMKIKFGPKFANDYKPELYTNSLGNRNVRYVKKDNCDIKDNMSSLSTMSEPLFPDFASQKNSANFGDNKSEFLFGSNCDTDENHFGDNKSEFLF